MTTKVLNKLKIKIRSRSRIPNYLLIMGAGPSCSGHVTTGAGQVVEAPEQRGPRLSFQEI